MKAMIRGKYSDYLWILGLIPILLYFKNIGVYSQNIPHWDDYAIISFLNKWHDSNSFSEKISLLFAQHNEHRIAFTRLVALFIAKIKGSLDFQWMIYFGNLALVFILAIFYIVLKKSRLSTIYILPICFSLFQLSLYENTFWGMASVQNFWVIFFVLMAFWRISHNKIPYLWAFLAAFTSGNGILFVPLIGILIFIFQKEWRLLLRFSIFCLFLIFLYFYTYQAPPSNQPIQIDLLNNGKAALMLVGSNFDILNKENLKDRALIAAIFGSLFLIITLLLFLSKLLKDRILGVLTNQVSLFLVAVLLFALGTCLLTSITRLQYGFYVFLTSKYKIYSILIFIVLYLIALIRFQFFGKKLILALFSIITIFVYFFNYYNSLGPIGHYQKSEISSFYNGWHNGKAKTAYNSKSCFNYQSTILDNKLTDISAENQTLGKVYMLNNQLIIENDSYVLNGNDMKSGAYLEVVSEDNRYIFATKQAVFNSKKDFLRNRKISFNKGFNAEIPLVDIESGNYFINILDKKDNDFYRINNNYYIEIESIKTPKIIQNW